MGDAHFWTSVGELILQWLLALGVVGGVAWKFLERIVENKVAHQLHQRNTVFTRIDQKRAEFVLELNGQMRVHFSELIYFSPRATWKTQLEPHAAIKDAVAWCFERQQASSEIFRFYLKQQLLVPDEFSKNFALWLGLTQEFSTRLMLAFMAEHGKPDFEQKNDRDQRAALWAVHTAFLAHPRGQHHVRLCHRIFKDLAAVFLAEGEIPKPAELELPPPDAMSWHPFPEPPA